MAITQDQQFTNNATTTVPGTISNVATSITVSTGTGDLFPSLTGAQFAVCTIVNTIASDPGYGQLEIVKVTARSGDVFTVIRGQESTTAKSFPAGCVFELRPTAGGINEVYNKMIAGDALQAPLASPVFTGNPTAPTPATGDNDTSLATTAYVQTTALQYNREPRNIIINPHGSIQQETTTPVTAGSYFADQWVYDVSVPSGQSQVGVINSTVSAYDTANMFIKTTIAKGALVAGDIATIRQPVEGSYARRLLYGGASAKGSWVRWRASASQSGMASISIRNGATNRSFVQAFAVTTTPTDFFLYVPGDTSGTWPGDTSTAAHVTFCFAAGTTWQTSTLGAWQAGNFVAANTQSNMLDTVNRQLNITDVQWSLGDSTLSSAPSFTPIDYQQELAKCQRYWQKSYPTSSPITLAGSHWSGIQTSFLLNSPTTYFRVEMRTTPTATIISPQNGAGVAVAEYDPGSSFVSNRNVSATSSATSLSVQCSSLTVGNNVKFHWIANARM